MGHWPSPLSLATTRGTSWSRRLPAGPVLMSFPPGTEMFQFPGFASQPYVFRSGYPSQGGLPHSDIPGSQPARGSPGLIAACHVLHRLLAPRHPPDALLVLAPTLSSRSPRTAPTRAAQKPQRSGQNQPLTYTLHTCTPCTRVHTHTHIALLTRTSPAPSRKMAVRHKPCRAPHERPNPDSQPKDHITPTTPQRPVPLHRAGPGHHRDRSLPTTTRAPRPLLETTLLETTLLETAGLEPATPCLQSRCSPS